MIINHNISAINAHRVFNINAENLQKSIEKLSSGLRINKGLDDPAGLAVSEKMRAQIRGLHVSSRNAQDGISFLQTAEGWMSETTEILHRMRELAVQTSNGIYTSEDRQQIQVEIEQLVDEVDRIASQAEYNGMRLLKGGFKNPNVKDTVAAAPTTKEAGSNSAMRVVPKLEPGQGTPNDLANPPDGGVALHIGPNMDQREKIYIENMSAAALGLADGEDKTRKLKVDYSSQDNANQAIGKIDAALNYVNKQRADLGAYQMRLEITSRGIDVAAENLQSAESRVRDTDMALEMVQYVRTKILTESSASLLNQANMKPFIVKKLLENM
ncbi:MAG: flagellin [Spirochaetota bacterium]|nr:flagellin [Spirochaetota bacterium]